MAPAFEDHPLRGAEGVPDRGSLAVLPVRGPVADLVGRGGRHDRRKDGPTGRRRLRGPTGTPAVASTSRLSGIASVIEVVGLQGLLHPLEPVPCSRTSSGVRSRLELGGDPPWRERIHVKREDGSRHARAGDHEELQSAGAQRGRRRLAGATPAAEAA